MIEIGQFIVMGDWDIRETPKGKIRIIMPPLENTFGAGWHICTKNAILALMEYLKVGMTFAEIGAGSGILCVVAKKLGASKCYATELNVDALNLAAKVFNLNDVDAQLINGSFINEMVDLAIVSISTDWFKKNCNKINAKKILVVHDDASIGVIE